MLQKGLIALLVLMLVVTVVFTSFGIAYSKTDFMSTMLKVEHGLGDTSDKTLELYGKTKTFFTNVYSAIDNLIDVSATYEKVFNATSRFFSKVNACFSLAQKYGFGFGEKTKHAYSVLLRGFDYEPFWSENDFDIENALKIVGCLAYDEENEYSYSFYSVKHTFGSTKRTIVKYGLYHHVSDYDSLRSDDSFGWLEAPSLGKPDISDPLVSHFMTPKMLCEFVYDNLQLPITSTNIKYRFEDGSVLSPIAMIIRRSSAARDISLGSLRLGVLDSPELYVLIDNVPLCVDFVFQHASATLDFQDTLHGGDVLHTLYYRDIVTFDSEKSWFENQIYYWKNLLNRFSDYYLKSFPAGAHMGGRDF